MMVQRTILSLRPQEFENLIFDLLRVSGMRNLVWRTPGSDGGRDLEGQHIDHDFSGSYKVYNWYIEAKRYSASVDWPTVWNKISYAQSAGAHYLLMTTTSTYSPRCLDEIQKWNQRDIKPTVRAWSRPEIEFRVRQQPGISLKYSLGDSKKEIAPAFLPLALHLAKSTMAASEALDALGSGGPFLQLSAALSELLMVRSEDFHTAGRIIVRSALRGENWYPWLREPTPATLEGMDVPAARALASALRVLSGSEIIEVSRNPDRTIAITSIAPRRTDIRSGRELIDTIAHWGDFEVSIEGADFIVSTRSGDA